MIILQWHLQCHLQCHCSFSAELNYNYTLEPKEIHVTIAAAPKRTTGLSKDGRGVGYTPCEIVGKKGDVVTLKLNEDGYDTRTYKYTFDINDHNKIKTFDVPNSPIVNTSATNNLNEYIIIHGYHNKGKLYVNGKYEGDIFPGNDGKRIIYGDKGAKCKIEVKYDDVFGKKTNKITVKFGECRKIFTMPDNIWTQEWIINGYLFYIIG